MTNDHQDHTLTYHTERTIVTGVAATLDHEGNVITSNHPDDATETTLDISDAWVWCATCGYRLTAGLGGLSEEWQAR